MKSIPSLPIVRLKIKRLISGHKEKVNIETTRANRKLHSLVNGLANCNEKQILCSNAICKKLTNDYIRRFKIHLARQRATAEDIDLFDVFGFTPIETQHSKFLIYLFDPLGSHAQGNLFFKIFLKAVGLPPEYATIDYSSKPEVGHDESRIDIEISSKAISSNGFIIHIENKVGDTPTIKQIEREERDLIKKAKTMNIRKRRIHGFLLSPQKDIKLKNRYFRWIGWNKIKKCVNVFIEESQAKRAEWIGEQYKKCIEKQIEMKYAKFITMEEKNDKTQFC